MCNIRWYRYVVIVSVSVDLWVNAIIGTVVVNYTADALSSAEASCSRGLGNPLPFLSLVFTNRSLCGGESGGWEQSFWHVFSQAGTQAIRP